MEETNDEHITTDGMPMQRAPTVRLIFASEDGKNFFLGKLADGLSVRAEIGASDSEPLFDAHDISVRPIDDNGQIVL
jgi:hypothetical protein